VIGTGLELALIKSSLRLPALVFACACLRLLALACACLCFKALKKYPGPAPGLALPVCQACFQVLRCRAYCRAKSVA